MPIFLERRHAARLLATTRVFAVAVPLLVASCGNNNSQYVTSVPNRVAVADLNGDGLNDLVVVSAEIDQTAQKQNSPGLVGVILQSGTTHGTFQTTVDYHSSGNPSGLAVADLTGSGSKDIVVANYSNGDLSVLLHSSTAGQLQTAISVPTGGYPNDVVAADMNGDGLLDLVVADGGSVGHVIIIPQDPSNPGHFLAPVTSAALPNRAIRVAVADLNGDGKPDVVVTSFDTSGNGGTVSILFQDPANPLQFLPRVDIATPGNDSSPGEPAGIAIADLNGDGLLDIVVACEGPGSDTTGNTGADVFLQTSPGVFDAGSTYYAYVGSLSVAVGDINGDGKPDLVLASQYPSGSGELTLLLQDPANPGQFLATTETYLTGLGKPVSVVLGDLNGDGLLDIATADGTGAVVYFQTAGSPGTFAAGYQVGG